jgi:hypothetical protein
VNDENTFTYLRLYADEAGESHFEDVDVALVLTDFAPPAAPAYLASLGEASAIVVVAGDRSWGGEEPHPAPARQFTLSITGTLEVTTSDGERRRIGPGQLLLLDDTTGKGHSTRALGEVTFLVIRAPVG